MSQSVVCVCEHQTGCITVSQLTSPAAALLSVDSDFHSCFTSDHNTVIDATAGVFDWLSLTKPLTGQEEVLGKRQLDLFKSFPKPLSNWLTFSVPTQVIIGNTVCPTPSLCKNRAHTLYVIHLYFYSV